MTKPAVDVTPSDVTEIEDLGIAIIEVEPEAGLMQGCTCPATL
jgi:hypothetical protein